MQASVILPCNGCIVGSSQADARENLHSGEVEASGCKWLLSKIRLERVLEIEKRLSLALRRQSSDFLQVVEVSMH